MKKKNQQKGVALVVTLIVLTALAVVAVSMITVTSIDRTAVVSSANIYRAQLAAEAGVQTALATLMQTTKTQTQDPTYHGPYATVFSRDSAGGTSPYLLLARRDLANNAVRTQRLPLFSSTYPWNGHFDNLAAPFINTASQSVIDKQNGNNITRNVARDIDIVYDINQATASKPNGLVGLSRNGARVSIPVNWIYHRDQSGTVVGRYAYWVDDESSKFDLRFVGGGQNGMPVERAKGTDRAEISLSALEERGISEEQIDNLRRFKASNLPVEEKSFARFSLGVGTEDISDDDLWDEISPYLTAASMHDRRAPDGKLKLDLNKLIKASPDDTTRIKKELDTIVSAIKENLPEFKARAASDATDAEQEFYLLKIAANIRDFVDEDSTPTMVARDGTVLSFPGIAPDDFIPLGTDLVINDIPAIGKEKGPFLSEYLRIVRVVSETPVAGVPNMFDLQVVFAHYVELHNPTGAAITAADLPGAYVLLANRERWQNGAAGGNPVRLTPADIVMRLPNNFSIPPNGYITLTTDNAVIPQVTGTVYSLTRGEGAGQWDTIDRGGSTPPQAGAAEQYAVRTTSGKENGRDRVTRFNFFTPISDRPYEDSSERLIVGSAESIIDAAPKINTGDRVYFGRGAENPAYMLTFPNDPGSTSERNRDLNFSRFSRGDLRANMEISKFGNHSGGNWKDAGSVYGVTNFTSSSYQVTLGQRNRAYNRQDSPTGDDWWRMGWKEYTDPATNPAGNHFVANRPLRSVGELGFIYDPARHSLAGFRAHGATLRMGQSDAGTNNRAQNNTGINYRNWLGGRGSDDPSQIEYLRNSFLLADVFCVNDIDRGRVNPNSIVRDEGFVFRGLIDGFKFETSAQENASSALSDKTINSDTFLPATAESAASGGGLLSVGDLSRVGVFHSGTELSGVDMAGATVSDSGREEFFRRSADLLATHSLAFTIYSIGQAGRFKENEFQPTASSISEVLVQIVPEYPNPADDFDRVSPTKWTISRIKQMKH